MKSLLIYLLAFTPIALASCASLGEILAPAPVTIETSGTLGRTAQRILDRHDAYVLHDAELSLSETELAQQESYAASALIEHGTPQYPLAVLEAMEPVADRHDAYVQALEADPLIRDIFLGDTASLLSLLRAAAPQQ